MPESSAIHGDFNAESDSCQNCESPSTQTTLIVNKYGDEHEYKFCGDGCEGQYMRENKMSYDAEEDAEITEDVDDGCCFCGADYGRYGNNAQPLFDGRCCNNCNTEMVIPARISMMFGAEEYKHCDGCEEVRSIDDFSLSNDPEQTLTEGEVCDYCFGDIYGAENSTYESVNTDKYEGHTPAEEWGDIVYADGYGPVFLDDDVYATDLDTQLMADAPLLLAEVKRLQDSLKDNMDAEDMQPLFDDLKKQATKFTGMTILFTGVAAVGGYLIGRNRG